MGQRPEPGEMCPGKVRALSPEGWWGGSAVSWGVGVTGGPVLCSPWGWWACWTGRGSRGL